MLMLINADDDDDTGSIYGLRSRLTSLFQRWLLSQTITGNQKPDKHTKKNQNKLKIGPS